MTVSCRLRLRWGRTDVLHIKAVMRRYLERLAGEPLRETGITIFEGVGTGTMHVLGWGETA